MPTTTNIKLRNEEVQEILTKIPHWMIRWGNLVILMIVLLIFFFSYLIKYPEIISTRIKITTEPPPEELYAKTSGKIKKIFVADKDTVNSGNPLAIVQNTANYKDIFLLKNKIDSISKSGYGGNFYFPFNELPTMQLGQIQSAFILFEKAYIAYDLNRRLQPYQAEKEYQSSEADYLRERLLLLKQQREFEEEEMVLKENEVKRYNQLYKNKVISNQEWEKKQIEISQAKKDFKNLILQISQLESSINDLKRDSKSTTIEKSMNNITLLRSTLQAFDELKTAIAKWEQTFVLRSSINGQVSFMGVWSENQSVNAGQLVLTIIPLENKDYVGKALASAKKSGKLKVGQKVNIHLDNYPDNEYGIIAGKIESISLTPNSDGNLLLDISLPDELLTSYGKTLEFQQGMTGTADIVTEELRLIERLLYQFRDIFKR